jgi:predicted phosphodiesterase
MDKETIRIAVVSDLHVYTEDYSNESEKPGFIRVNGDNSPLTNPVEGLSKLIESDDLYADYLVCAGDLTNKADPKALKFGWELLHRIKNELGAGHLYATAGNHDLDSRNLFSPFDAKEQIQSLEPYHPVDLEREYDKYWARHYTILEHDEIRFLLLNSAAYHGYKDEYKHGRVSEKTIHRIRNDLHGREKKLNILLVHHHPHRHQELSLNDYSAMDGGELLIDTLNKSGLGCWLIIHGHRHMPTIGYSASSSSEAAIVFAAGSFSAVLYPDIQSRARNQFYIIEIKCKLPLKSKNLFMAGKYRAWDWISHIGWQSATEKSGLPAQGGFGARLVISSLADEISDFINNSEDGFLSIDELLTQFQELEYLVPEDLKALVKSLAAQGIHCSYNSVGTLEEMGKRK